MSTPAVKWNRASILVVLLLAGCLSPGKHGPEEDAQPLMTPGVLGNAGNLTLQVPGLTWVDFVIELPTDDRTPRFSFNVEWVFTPEGRPLQSLFTLAIGARITDGNPSEAFGGRCLYGLRQNHPPSLTLEASGVRQEVISPVAPSHEEKQTCGARGSSSWFVDQNWLEGNMEHARRGSDQPVVEFFAAIGPHNASTIPTIRLNWSGAPAFLTYGSDSMVVRSRDDFSADARIRAEGGPIRGSASRNLKLREPLGGTDRALVIDYLPLTGIGGMIFSPTLERASFKTPDGKAHAVSGEKVIFSPLAGNWTFEIPGNLLLTNSDLPALVALSYAPAPSTAGKPKGEVRLP